MTAAIYINIAGGLLQLVGVVFLMLDLYKNTLADLWAWSRSLPRRAYGRIEAAWRRLARRPRSVTIHPEPVTGEASLTLGGVTVSGTGNVDNWNVLDVDGRLEALRQRCGFLEKKMSSMQTDTNNRLDNLAETLRSEAKQIGQNLESIRSEWQKDEEQKIRISKRSSLPLLVGIFLSAVVSPIVQLTAG
jgi:hypothetical protein